MILDSQILKKGTKNLVYLWAKKEFRNLSQCYDAGIPVPKPLYVTNNVLAMDFVGQNGISFKILLDSEVLMKMIMKSNFNYKRSIS